jgi:hypothetical protein
VINEESGNYRRNVELRFVHDAAMTAKQLDNPEVGTGMPQPDSRTTFLAHIFHVFMCSLHAMHAVLQVHGIVWPHQQSHV